MNVIRRKVLRVLPPDDGKGPREWCRLEVEIREREPDKRWLSICGSAGYVLTPAEARREAREYWESFFEDSPDEIKAMNDRCGTNFRSTKSAARYVLDNDGEYHGIDAEEYTLDGKDVVLVCHSCGQIREEIARFFPEAVPYFKWHLNGMRPSPERREMVENANGQIHEKITPAGAAWEYEPLPPEVIAWAEGLGKEAA